MKHAIITNDKKWKFWKRIRIHSTNDHPAATYYGCEVWIGDKTPNEVYGKVGERFFGYYALKMWED